jgi:hypothetical protein
MRIARWINNVTHAQTYIQTHTHTYSKYETHCFSMAEMVMRRLFNVIFISTLTVSFITGSLYLTTDRWTHTRLLAGR